MKHKHKWQISHTNKEFSSLGFSGTSLDGWVEFAYIICEECGEVRKKKVKEYNNTEELNINVPREAPQIPCGTTAGDDPYQSRKTQRAIYHTKR